VLLVIVWIGKADKMPHVVETPTINRIERPLAISIVLPDQLDKTQTEGFSFFLFLSLSLSLSLSFSLSLSLSFLAPRSFVGAGTVCNKSTAFKWEKLEFEFGSRRMGSELHLHIPRVAFVGRKKNHMLLSSLGC
jgi:hypothetical protein